MPELLTVVSISVIIMGVVFMSYSSYVKKLSLGGTSQQLAVMVHQAQGYALSARETYAGSSDFSGKYGISFDTDTPNAYFLFVDKNNNRIYDAGSGCGSANTECIENGVLTEGIRISALCGNTQFNLSVCTPSNPRSVTVIFTRPSPDAAISFTNPSGQHVLAGTYLFAKVTLTSRDGTTNQDVVITTAGQVTIGSIY